ncbi:TPA: hypothetical protein N0F65_008109 [Lagenidium giganteum]|uniref:YdbS-like PH domain-containing protein n=1 Tax=Lagenidium giganteum TaxID=4803 RepID=A0AAV2YX44_9STRA|nr:TPA: hypothetical protein N0F65_008109 [Lagenidium giganteum]
MDKNFSTSEQQSQPQGYYQHEGYPVAEPLLDHTSAEDGFEVAFDLEKGTAYRTCLGNIIAGVSCLWCAIPFMKAWQTKEMKAQKCRITDKRVVFESGWLNQSVKYIPLDRIQDINVKKSLTDRYFGISRIEIQTAGVGFSPDGQSRAEAVLIAPRDVEMVRDVLLERRDALVYGAGSGAPTATFARSYGGVDDGVRALTVPAAATNSVALDVRALRESVERLEAQVTTSLAKMEARTKAE